MDIKLPWVFLLCMLYFCCISGEDINCKNEIRCGVGRAHRMKAVDCYNKGLKSFPKCIPSDAEVLELSVNRIRKVSKADLARFSHIKILYLTDNLLVHLDKDIFKGMDSLNTLDISVNALAELPPTILQLPSLRKLYMKENVNINIVDALEQAKPISSPLELLDISFTTDEDNVSEFPDFGPLPLLESFNITGNHYLNMTPKHFAGLCKVAQLINVNVTVQYSDRCDCWVVNNWLKERKVEFTPFKCPTEENECADKIVDQEDLTTYNKCREVYYKIEKDRLLRKIGLGVGIAVAVVLVGVVAYFLLKKTGWLCETKKPEAKPVPPPQPDGLRLLNNQTKV